VLVLVLVGRSTLRRAKTPSPERAIREAKATTDALKANLRKTADDLTPRRNGKVPAGLTAAPGDAAITQSLAPRDGPSTPPLGTSTPTPTPRDVPPSDNEES